MKPLVSIQILNWNRPEETVRAIHSAREQTYQNIEIVVIDNGSTDHSVELIKQNFPDIKIIELDKNYGCPGGRNRGIQHCSGEYIFYLDNDGVLNRNAVELAVSVLEQDEGVAVVYGAVYDFDSPSEIDTNVIVKTNNNRYVSRTFDGGVSMHRKKIYGLVGFYPDHFMYGGEETFLSAKMLDNNLKIIKDEAIVLWHKRSDMARNREKEMINSFFNKLYIAVSLFPVQYAVAFVLYFPIKYNIYANKLKIGKAFRNTFLKRYFSTISKAIKFREPIKHSSYKLLMNNKK